MVNYGRSPLKYERKAYRASPANHRPFGTSGMASADSGWQMRAKGENGLPVSPSLGARAEAMPEASGDS